MGRVAKYKKVKAFDRHRSGAGEYIWGSNNGRPTNKKRSKTAEKLKEKKLKRKRNIDTFDDSGYDLPPTGKDEFDLSDFTVKKIKQQNLDDGLGTLSPLKTLSTVSPTAASEITSGDNVKIGNTAVTCHIPQDDMEERKTAKFLNIDTKSGKTKSETAKTIEGRKEGESMRAFNKRLKDQTRVALAQDFQKRSSNNNSSNNNDLDGESKGKKEKRKEFMKMKKLKKKKNSAILDNSEYDGNNSEQDERDFVAEKSTTSVIPSFLQQVEAPPTFNLLPRGATKKSKLKPKKDHSGMDEKSIKAEQDAMEALRRKIQAQYTLVKAQRRKEGAFHL